jgi:hypothetical protein
VLALVISRGQVAKFAVDASRLLRAVPWDQSRTWARTNRNETGTLNCKCRVQHIRCANVFVINCNCRGGQNKLRTEADRLAITVASTVRQFRPSHIEVLCHQNILKPSVKRQAEIKTCTELHIYSSRYSLTPCTRTYIYRVLEYSALQWFTSAAGGEQPEHFRSTVTHSL